MVRYSYLPDDEIVIRNRMDGSALERYDPTLKQWVPDWDLSEVYTGDVRVWPIREDELWRYLK